MPINRIQPSNDNTLGTLLTIGGMAAGGALAGPGIAATLGGAATGGGLGSTAGNILSPAQQQLSDNGGSGGSETAAILRKQQQMSQNSLDTLKNAEAQLPSLPESLRQQYAPAIVQARMYEQQKQGYA